MTDIEKEMLEQCGGDTVAYHNMIAFGNFLCEMINKYGDKILEDIEKEEKEQSKESGERKEESHSR
ncbi:MAG TPA: hypothetical protein DHV96_14200 [Lachnospiraceae bacterium]|nr:hypothetical protein [Lachnospiraceae bacterium]